MIKYFACAGLLISVLLSSFTNAANFVVYNRSGYDISLQIPNRPSRVIDNGSEMRIDTGFDKVEKIIWTESAVELGNSDYNIRHSATYSLNLQIPALSLGGKFFIGKGGEYSYNSFTFMVPGQGKASKL